MKIRVSVAVCLLVVVGACESAQYQSRSASSWIIDLDHDEDFKRRDALVAVAAMAKDYHPTPQIIVDALPQIHDLLNDPNPGVQVYARDALVAVGGPAKDMLIETIRSAQPNLRFHAAAGLVAFDPYHERGNQVLVETVLTVANAELAKEAHDALLRLGTPAVPHLEAKLSVPHDDVRAIAIDTLGDMEANARAAAPKLRAIAREDASRELRLEAIIALAKIESDDSARIIFDELRKDADDQVATQAAMMLRRFENRDVPTVGEIEEAAKRELDGQ